MIMKISYPFKVAAYRAARTFAQAFVGVIGATWIADGSATITSLVHTVAVTSDRAGGSGLIAALAALGLNFVKPNVKPEG